VTTPSDRTELRDRLLAFVRDHLAAEIAVTDVTTSTPLLTAGILDSLRTARLISWLRDTVGVRVPPREMTGGNFRDIETITDLVLGLRAAS
jgi:acyl carrier protein